MASPPVSDADPTNQPTNQPPASPTPLDSTKTRKRTKAAKTRTHRTPSQRIATKRRNDRSCGILNQHTDRDTEKPKTRMRPEQAAAARDEPTHKPVTRSNTKAQRAPPQGAPPKGVTFPFGAHDG